MGKKKVAYDWKVGCNIVEYTIAFVHSDWLYFLCHGINTGIMCYLFAISLNNLIIHRARKIFEFHLARWASNP